MTDVDAAAAVRPPGRTAAPGLVYEARAKAAAGRRAAWQRRSSRISTARLLLFFGILALLAGGVAAEGGMAVLLYGLAALAGAAFVWLLGHHARVDARAMWEDALWRVNHEAAARVERRWDQLERQAPPSAPDAAHPYSADLDLFGRASLFQLLAGALATTGGRERLATWLLAPADAAEILARQAAVAELAVLPELRERLAVEGRLLGTEPRREVRAFLEWAEAAPLLVSRRWLVWIVRGLTVAIWTLIVLNAAGLVPYVFWAVLLAPSLLLTALYLGPLSRTLEGALSLQDAWQRYARLFELVGEARFETILLRRTHAALEVERHPAHWHMRRLHRIGGFGNLRYASPLLHLPLQALTLWDFHVGFALERWRHAAGRRARGWLAALADVEALAALAWLAHDNPEWTFPSIERPQPVLEARRLGHPLLPRSARVANDVTIGPPGTFLFVTGSNMSGKSTLLRAVGLNAVLAEAGGPVCAASLRMPPVRVHTSMRVQDSLEQNLSYFMAALRRLQGIVEAARQPDERVLLYLLDEILQGTNTAERRVAVRTVVTYLLERGALGAITSHDLTLAERGRLAAAARPVHFTETVGAGGTMSFDYRLRDGVARSRNALRLMQAIGLDPVEE